ncbi:hypothetical protein ACFVFS_20245 [Kitasatospora sp. NPDC057692]|uniref:P-loop NTPase n=1 Tax=Kitasatospora sp. NPDC057692 TaxID=3346215 RepID=UPI0036C99B55
MTSAHIVARVGERVVVFRPGHSGTAEGLVVWCGTPGARDDAALVLVDDNPHWTFPAAPVRWGRFVTAGPGIRCDTWGLPDTAQRPGRAVEAEQIEGAVNPGSGYVGNQYVLDLRRNPPQWHSDGMSPWGGMSGAPVACNELLMGVVAADRARSNHSQFNVVPAYVLHHDLAFREALATYGAGLRARLEAAELQHLDDRGPDAVPGGSLHSSDVLLHARRQIVPLWGRDALVTELRAWCEPSGFGAWLLYGPGGQGKTRLAHHLTELLAAERWAVLWPRANAGADRLRDLRHVSRPLLVVLDRAEARTDQIAALVDVAADHPGSTPFKVLLLARTKGGWWNRATTDSGLAEAYLGSARTHLLTPLAADPARRAAAYREAAAAFAAALPGVEGLTTHNWPAVVDALTVPGLRADAYGNALTLYTAVLADLLDAVEPHGRGRGRGKATGTARPGPERLPELVLRWLARQCGRDLFKVVNLDEFATARSVPSEATKEAALLLEQRGLVVLTRAPGRSVHARLSVTGLQEADGQEARLRSTSARLDHTLALLMTAAAAGPLGGLELDEFTGSAALHGEPLTVDETVRGVRYLHDHGLVTAGPDPQHPRNLLLTPRGWDCALSAKRVRDFVNAQDASSPVLNFHQHVHGGTATQAYQVTQHVTTTTGLGVAELTEVIGALRRAAPQLAPGQQEEFLQDVDVMEDVSEADPTRRSAGERIRARLIDSAVPELVAGVVPLLGGFLGSLVG